MFLWLTTPLTGRPLFQSKGFFDISEPDASGLREFAAHGDGAGNLPLLSMRAAQFGPNGLPVVFDKGGRLLEVLDGPKSKTGVSLVSLTKNKSLEIGRVSSNASRTAQFTDNQGKPIPYVAGGKNFLSGLSVQNILTKGDSRNTSGAVRGLFAALEKAAPATAPAAADELVDPSAIVRRFEDAEGGVVFINALGQVIDIGGIAQAESEGVLVAQSGALVFYSTTVNDAYVYLHSKNRTATNPVPSVPPQFPTTKAEIDQVADFATDRGLQPLSNPDALVMIVKAAWVEVTAGMDASRYLTIDASVPAYDKSDPARWVKQPGKAVRLAMVGMHVVGSTKGHPELIWATFEHVSNTPNAAYSYIDKLDRNISVAQSTAGDWLFAKRDAGGPFNEISAIPSGQDIVATGSKIGPTDVIRWKAWGSASDSPGSARFNTEVISINNSVRSQLLASDVRANYIMVGATWTIGGAAPNTTNQVGTNLLANSTMETFEQGNSNLTPGGSSNCFSCHKTKQFRTSHLFTSVKPIVP